MEINAKEMLKFPSEGSDYKCGVHTRKITLKIIPGIFRSKCLKYTELFVEGYFLGGENELKLSCCLSIKLTIGKDEIYYQLGVTFS